DSSATSGHIMLGYADTINGIAEVEHGDGVQSVDTPPPTGGNPATPADANFAIFDNVSVDTITQTRQKWQVNGSANWSNALAWQNGDIADGVAEVADFTTTLTAQAFAILDSPRTV